MYYVNSINIVPFFPTCLCPFFLPVLVVSCPFFNLFWWSCALFFVPVLAVLCPFFLSVLAGSTWQHGSSGHWQVLWGKVCSTMLSAWMVFSWGDQNSRTTGVFWIWSPLQVHQVQQEQLQLEETVCSQLSQNHISIYINSNQKLCYYVSMDTCLYV